MNPQLHRELNQLVNDWFMAKGLVKAGDFVLITVSINPIPPAGTEPDDANRKDKEALGRVLGRMTMCRTRMTTCLIKMGITRLSQVVARSSWDEWRCDTLGIKTLKAFAGALEAEGIDCYVTRNFLNLALRNVTQSEFDSHKTRALLTEKDWNEIFKIDWDIFKIGMIELLERQKNKPISLANAAKSGRSVKSPALVVSDINYRLRVNKLPYRLKVGEVPSSGIKMDRLVQFVALEN